MTNSPPLTPISPQNVRVWDLQGCTCLQSIHSRNVPMSRLPISSIHYNRDTNILVLATSLVGALTLTLLTQTVSDRLRC